MSKQGLWWVLAALAATVAVVLGAAALLRGAPGVDQAAAPETAVSQQPASESAEIPGAELRPDCVAGGLGGIDLPCLGGETVSGAHADVTVVNIWAWWCGPCRDELPLLNEFAARHPDVDVVGVHVDAKAASGVALLNDLDIQFPSYQDASGVLPTMLGLPNVVPLLVVYKGGEPVTTLTASFATVEELEDAIWQVL